MRGCGCLIGVLLIVAAVGALMLVVVLPSVMQVKDVPPLNNLLQTVYCEKGETLSTEQHVGPSYDGGTSYSATFYCDNNDGPKRDVTGRATMIGILAFVVPFLIGLFLLIGSSVGMARRTITDSLGGDVATIFSISNPAQVSSFGATGQKDSVTERLRDLKSAYDQGLITEAEYELKRKEILRQM